MYRTRSVFSWQQFSDSLVIAKYDWMNSRCTFFIMQNAGYKHFGFLHTIFLAPYYITSRTFAKIKKIYWLLYAHNEPLNLAYTVGHWDTCCAISSFHGVVSWPPQSMHYLRPWNMAYCPNESQILNFFTVPVFFIDPWTWQIVCHQPISCHGFSATAEDVKLILEVLP